MKGRHANSSPSRVKEEKGAPLPYVAALRSDMRNNLLSGIEDYCILFGTDDLPALRDYLAQATAGWTKRPDLGLVD